MLAFENEFEDKFDNDSNHDGNHWRKNVVNILYNDSPSVSCTLLKLLNTELRDLTSVYCHCLSSLCLPGNTSIEAVLNTICHQSSHCLSFMKRRALFAELEKKRLMIQAWLRALKKECSMANSLVKQGSQCKKQFSEKILFYAKKFEEYRDEIKLLENHLYGTGFNGGLKNEALKLLKEENTRLTEELNICSKKVEEYSHFEASNTSLRRRIAELSTEIKEYDKYFNRDSL